MAQHYLDSKQLTDITTYKLLSMPEDALHRFVADLRWNSDGQQHCPGCGEIADHYWRAKRKRWRCKSCYTEFSVTSGTLFHGHKVPLRKIVAAMMLSVEESSGLSARKLRRQIDVHYKTAFVMNHRLREGLLRNRDLRPLEGEVHIDGGYFGGKPRKGNRRRKASPEEVQAMLEARMAGRKVHRRQMSSADRANAKRRLKRRVVLVMREVKKGCGGQRTIAIPVPAETAEHVIPAIEKFVRPGSIVMTDEAPAYLQLGAKYDHRAVDHSQEFVSATGVNENQAESYFSRLRRSEYGIHHRMVPNYLADYANEKGWREDVRRVSQLQKLRDLAGKVFRPVPRSWWRGYWQGRHRTKELLLEYALHPEKFQ